MFIIFTYLIYINHFKEPFTETFVRELKWVLGTFFKTLQGGAFFSPEISAENCGSTLVVLLADGDQR